MSQFSLHLQPDMLWEFSITEEKLVFDSNVRGIEASEGSHDLVGVCSGLKAILIFLTAIHMVCQVYLLCNRLYQATVKPVVNYSI